MITRNGLFFVLVLSMLACTVHATDLASNSQVIEGSWYCPPTRDLYNRFDFYPDGTFMWLSYQPSKKSKYLWTPSFSEPWHYTFRTPTIIDAFYDKNDGSNNTFIIDLLTPNDLRFRWIAYGVETPYTCTRTRPPSDTDESRSKGTSLTNAQKKPFLGKWKTLDGKEYVEFLPGDVCIKGYNRTGRWDTMKDKFKIYHEGKTAICGESPFTRETPGKIVLDHGMGGDPITYHRVKSSNKR